MMDAKRQLSVLASWKYGKESIAQELGKKLTQAYNGLLEYILWCDKNSSLSNKGKITSFPFVSTIQAVWCHNAIEWSKIKLSKKTKQLFNFEKICFVQLHY